jgi:hypothetical protein
MCCRLCLRAILLVSVLTLICQWSAVLCQTSGESKQFWPTFNSSFELSKRSRITANVENHNGEDAPYDQWKVGAVFSYRLKEIGEYRRHDVDKENEYNLVLGGGYEFLRTDQNGSKKNEHRILVQAIPKYVLFARILAQDRNRMEFRWNNGTYDFRYRNRLTVDRPFKLNKVRFIPYASGELFWDRNHHSWNENQYAFGVRWPYKKSVMLDTHYLHQNCTTCSLNPLNVFGVTLNLYFDWPGK